MISQVQLTMRDTAYNETLDWLLNDKEGPEPQPPIGMHELAVAEWEAGRKEAYEAEIEGNAWADMVIDGLIAAVKGGLAFGAFWLGQKYGWAGTVMAFLIVVACFWKFSTPRSEQ